MQTVNQFRSSFPPVVNAGTLQKLGYAPNNESYVLNVLRFLQFIDDEGKRTDAAAKVFNLHDDAEFAKAFSALVRESYRDLFGLHQEASWTLDTDALITFFRSNDATSAIVGKRQASTFQVLAAFSGHGDVPEPRSAGSRGSRRAKTGSPKKTTTKATEGAKGVVELPGTPPVAPAAVGLTVRIEVNLPSDGDQATYDRIFKSIRENLLNG